MEKCLTTDGSGGKGTWKKTLKKDGTGGYRTREFPTSHRASRFADMLSGSAEEPLQSGFGGFRWTRMDQSRCKLGATPK